jgi:adenylylsulfate kinase
MNQQPAWQPCVVFLTGLSGAGKTTIANKLVEKLKEKKITPVLLDGDEIRKAIQVTGFDEASRKKHNLSTGTLASLLEAQGHIVITALIAPYEDVRQEIRKLCNCFYEIYISTDITVCIQRDPKGLYQKAISGEIKDFTGISAPYETPQNPELVLDTALLSVDECASKIIAVLKGHA